MQFVLTATEARTNFYNLIDAANASHHAILIRGKRKSAVLIECGHYED